MKINIMKLKLTALLLVLYTGLYAQNKIVLTAPRLDTSSLSNRINLKANTNLNNVNGVLSSTYGGAGSVSGILKANGSGVVSAATASDIPSLSAYYLPLSGGTLTGALSGTSLSMSGAGSFLGNLGVGTASPSGKLTINTPDENHIRMENGSELGIVRLMDNGTLELWGHGDTNNEIAFRQGSGSGTIKAMIATDGKFLINTTTNNGTDALQVAGSGLFTGTLKTGTGSGNTLSSGSVDVGKDIGLAATQGIVVNNARVLSFASTGAITASSTANSDWGLSVLNSGTTGANGLYVNIGSGATGVPFRVDKNGSSLFTIANSGAITASSSVTASSLIKSGGTSAQFLKADGSVDGSTYLTSASVGDGTLTLAVSGSGLSGSQSFTANQSSNATFTVTSNATTAATASTIAYRDGSGNLNAVGFFETSSIKLKDVYWQSKQSDNIDFIGFKWKKELNLDSKKHLGVIAEQVEKVLPDAVNIGENGVKSVNYNEVIIYKLEKLTNRVAELEKKLEQITKKAKK